MIGTPSSHPPATGARCAALLVVVIVVVRKDALLLIVAPLTLCRLVEVFHRGDRISEPPPSWHEPADCVAVARHNGVNDVHQPTHDGESEHVDQPPEADRLVRGENRLGALGHLALCHHMKVQHRVLVGDATMLFAAV
eukprot:CAMPEP_0119069622 /NCGR_PEP_ID=MMETSP1178-20130426/24338_1 /TAXON_ID=33656 /ORGANISM="unid sp, Strain CCMP2000" /LENGTH=137 /DNA_ID=CAMNT_0007051399 /DNA_START=213 /DNA_END=626 /DNA_ORIENTATION=-